MIIVLIESLLQCFNRFEFIAILNKVVLASVDVSLYFMYILSLVFQDLRSPDDSQGIFGVTQEFFLVSGTNRPILLYSSVYFDLSVSLSCAVVVPPCFFYFIPYVA